MKFLYDKQGMDIFLRCNLENDENIDKVSYGMISNNIIEGVLPVAVSEIDSEKFLRYNISSYVSLNNMWKNVLGTDTVLDILINICNAVIEAEKFMISEDMFIWNESYVFYNSCEVKVGLVCLPIRRKQFQGNERELLKNFVLNARLNENEINNSSINVIMNYLNNNALNNNDFLKLLSGIKSSNIGVVNSNLNCVMNNQQENKQFINYKENNAEIPNNQIQGSSVKREKKGLFGGRKEKKNKINKQNIKNIQQMNPANEIQNNMNSREGINKNSNCNNAIKNPRNEKPAINLGFEVPGMNNSSVNNQYSGFQNSPGNQSNPIGVDINNINKKYGEISDRSAVNSVPVMAQTINNLMSVHKTNFGETTTLISDEYIKSNIPTNDRNIKFSDIENHDNVNTGDVKSASMVQIYKKDIPISKPANAPVYVNQPVNNAAPEAVNVPPVYVNRLVNNVAPEAVNVPSVYVNQPVNNVAHESGYGQSLSSDTKEDDMTTTVLTNQNFNEDKRIEEVGRPYLKDQNTGKKYCINKNVTVIGKSSAKSDIVLTNNAISRDHVHLYKFQNKILIEDQKSTNKTYINGKSIEPFRLVEIKNGDEMKLSNEVFIFNK